MAISKGTRFEIFKRDKFTCQYCGQTPPSVVLHVDHILASSKGGTDDPDNLVTACQPCNLGKSDKPLDVSASPLKFDAEERRERLEQLKAFEAFKSEENELRQQWLDDCLEHWAHLEWGKPTEEGFSYYPKMERSIRWFLSRLCKSDIIDAMNIAFSRFPTPSISTERYFYGVCWQKIRGEKFNPPVQK